MEETKRCPYCGEEILAIAKKCKHCGEWLDNNSRDTIPNSISNIESVNPIPQTEVQSDKKDSSLKSLGSNTTTSSNKKKWIIPLSIVVILIVVVLIILGRTSSQKELLFQKTPLKKP